MDQNRQERPAQVRGARSHPARVSQATYWRRRITVLGVAAGLLTAASWTVNGMLSASSTAGQANSSGGAGATPAAHISSDPAVTPPTPTPSARSSSKPAKHRAARRAHAQTATLACARGSVALSVSSPQYFYQMGKTPSFTVRAVSQASQPCRFNMSAKFVSVVIASNDRRIWSSADCASGAASNMVAISSDQPATLKLSWNRQASSPGCSGSGRSVRPGEYQVRAVAGRLHSRSVNFVLGAKGASGP